MKKSSYFFQAMFLLQLLIFCNCLHLSAQNIGTVLHINKLSEEGVLLDTGWKFIRGDNLHFATADFDDSQWQLINPTKEVKQYNDILGNNICWLRLSISLDSTAENEPVYLHIQQNAASEIYLDGKLFLQYGTISDTPSSIKGYNPLNQSLPLLLHFGGRHVIAVRICIPRQTPLFIYPQLNNNFFSARLGYWSQLQQSENSAFHNSFGMSFFKMAVFVVEMIMHFAFYFLYRKEKVNLWLGIFDLFNTAAYLLYALLVFKIHEVALSSILRIPGSLFFTIGSWFLLLATYSAFNMKRGVAWWVFFILMILFVVVYFTPFNNTIGSFANPQTFWYPILANAESIRLSIVSFRKKKGGAINPLSPVMIFCVLSVAASVVALQVKDFGSENLNFTFSIIISLALLGLPLTSFMYVAIEFRYYYRNLMKAQALRNKIAIDLHDDLGTKLSTVRMFLKSLKSNQPPQPSNETVLLDNSLSLLDTSIDDLRQVMNELKAPVLIERGYIAATEELINSINQLQQINFTLTHNELNTRMEQKTEYNLFRITQELINNTLKYADAKNVSLDIVNRDDKIIFMYEDDGKGFDVQTPKKGFGLSNIMTRAKALGAEVTFDSTPGTGFRTIIEIPNIYA